MSGGHARFIGRCPSFPSTLPAFWGSRHHHLKHLGSRCCRSGSFSFAPKRKARQSSIREEVLDATMLARAAERAAEHLTIDPAEPSTSRKKGQRGTGHRI